MFSPAKAITAGAIVFALGGVLLIAQPFDQGGSGVPGAAIDDEALRPALVTGTITYDEESGEFTCISGPFGPCVERPSADRITRFRTVGQTASVEMSDSRLTGDATVDEHNEGFSSFAIIPQVEGRDRAYYEEEGLGIGWSTVRIVNETGTWEGIEFFSSTIADDAPGMILLEGTGAYDGLSAILYAGSTGDDSLDGVIFPEISRQVGRPICTGFPRSSGCGTRLYVITPEAVAATE